MTDNPYVPPPGRFNKTIFYRKLTAEILQKHGPLTVHGIIRKMKQDETKAGREKRKRTRIPTRNVLLNILGKDPNFIKVGTALRSTGNSYYPVVVWYLAPSKEDE